MTHFFTFFLFLTLVFTLQINAQDDWHTYPVRSIEEIVSLNPPESGKNSEIIISGNPFPSKTTAVYLGKRRKIDELTRDFIKIWTQTRNVPAENADLLAEEMLFKANGKEYWIPVITRVSPFFDKQIKEGEEITIYYFFLGGFNPKKLNEKRTVKLESKEGLKDETNWIFAVETFAKSSYKKLALNETIDKNIKASDNKNGFVIDSRQLKNKAQVIFTGDVRKTENKKLEFIKYWLEMKNGPAEAVNLLNNEMRFTQDGKDFWMPIRKSILDEMQAKFKKGDSVVIHTILAGGTAAEDNIDWVFIVGEFTR